MARLVHHHVLDGVSQRLEDGAGTWIGKQAEDGAPNVDGSTWDFMAFDGISMVISWWFNGIFPGFIDVNWKDPPCYSWENSLVT